MHYSGWSVLYSLPTLLRLQFISAGSPYLNTNLSRGRRHGKESINVNLNFKAQSTQIIEFVIMFIVTYKESNFLG
jgi:hypothetical protein